MANVDITELIPNLEASLTIPGQVSPYDAATDTEWTVKLQNAFWRAVIDGVITGYSIDEDGIIKPDVTSGPALSRDLQQIVVIYAAINIIQATMLQLKTSFRAKAGSVEYETSQASQVLTGLLNMFKEEKQIILERLSDIGSSSESYYYDGPIQRRYAESVGDTEWIGY